MAMLLSWSGIAVTPDELAPQIWLPARRGTVPTSLIGTARLRDRLALPLSNYADLLREVAAGHPVLVLLDVLPGTATRWHYAVVTGYASAGQRLHLHSGKHENLTVGVHRFMREWSQPHWALVALPPGKLPASADAHTTLKAIASLEGAERYASATAGYRSASKRWPDLPDAWLGLSNNLYRSGDPNAAAEALERATEHVSESDVVLHNLAHIRLEQGRYAEARRWIDAGLALNGPQRERLHALRRELSD